MMTLNLHVMTRGRMFHDGVKSVEETDVDHSSFSIYNAGNTKGDYSK